MSKPDSNPSFIERFERNPHARFYDEVTAMKLDKIYGFMSHDSSKNFLKTFIENWNNIEVVIDALEGAGPVLFEVNSLKKGLDIYFKDENLRNDLYQNLQYSLENNSYENLDNFFHDHPKLMDFMNSKIRGMEMIRDAFGDMKIKTSKSPSEDTVISDIHPLWPEKKEKIGQDR